VRALEDEIAALQVKLASQHNHEIRDSIAVYVAEDVRLASGVLVSQLACTGAAPARKRVSANEAESLIAA
jgi:hypothetical protein